jgi:uncharacterized metal-binding protein YceD (DUF177 family)
MDAQAVIKSEFPRPMRLDAIGQTPQTLHLSAELSEREALARRFDLVVLDRLDVEVTVRREAAAVFAEGRVAAHVVQSCVVTGEPVPARVDAPFSLRFVPEAEIEAAEEIELSDADCDTLPYTGGVVDLGEAAAETLLLALDPFPRCADAEETLRSAGVVDESEAEVGPFAALKALKDKLGG